MKIKNLMAGLIEGLKPMGVVVGILAAEIILLNYFSIHTVSGDSMNPTFNDGDYILVALKAEPDDMDVIILTTAKIDNYKANGEHVIKRYYEDYSTNGYYVLGDNPEVSYDSRYYGEVSKEACEGVVVYDISKGFRSFTAAIKKFF